MGSTPGRPPNDHFEPDEALFVRFNASYLDEAKAKIFGIETFIIYKVDQSTNRSFPDGEPEDVLLPAYSDWGIASFNVSEIPPPHTIVTGQRFEFRIRHDPVEDNYYHSVIEVFHSGDPVVLNHEKVDKRARSYLRLELNKKTKVLKSLPPN